jgi:hypothetical protein
MKTRIIKGVECALLEVDEDNKVYHAVVELSQSMGGRASGCGLCPHVGLGMGACEPECFKNGFDNVLWVPTALVPIIKLKAI